MADLSRRPNPWFNPGTRHTRRRLFNRAIGRAPVPLTLASPEPFLDIADEGQAFDTDHSQHLWEAQWCAVCTRRPSCPSYTVAHLEMTPHAWTGVRPDYTCEEYEPARPHP